MHAINSVLLYLDRLPSSTAEKRAEAERISKAEYIAKEKATKVFQPTVLLLSEIADLILDVCDRQTAHPVGACFQVSNCEVGHFNGYYKENGTRNDKTKYVHLGMLLDLYMGMIRAMIVVLLFRGQCC